MSESAHIVDVLKRTLKAKGITYRDLAKRLELSEASVKRVFAEETFTLQRLEKICSAVGLSVGELVRVANDGQGSTSQYLSMEQEQLLAGNARLLACFYLLLNGRSSTEIVTRLALTEKALRSLYVKLDAARLIELQPAMKVRLRVGPVVAWRSAGPVHRLYEKQVRDEFLQSEFMGTDESLQFRSAELSSASIRILLRRLELLAHEFAELSAMDRGLPTKEKRSVALVAAFRPWVFSMFGHGFHRSG